MFDNTILRKIAQTADPSKLPASKLFAHTERTITIFDAFPKATFHFLVLPRVTGVEPRTATRLASLSALVKLRSGATRDDVRRVMGEAKEVLEGVKEDAVVVKRMVEEEMMRRFGCRWDVWMGFHAVPSMAHMHLHIISADLSARAMKTKRHYNSFHPTLGFFVHLDEVLEWFEAEPDVFTTLAKVNIAEHEAKLKEPLVCFRCHGAQRNVPALKEHLQAEFDALLEVGRRKEEEERGQMRKGKGKRRCESSEGSQLELEGGRTETVKRLHGDEEP